VSHDLPALKAVRPTLLRTPYEGDRDKLGRVFHPPARPLRSVEKGEVERPYHASLARLGSGAASAKSGRKSHARISSSQ